MSEIHLDNNVYILGAGFSRAAGMPVVSDFLNVMRDSTEWLAREEREDELAAVQEVFQFRLSAAAAALRTKLDVESIEELFSLASARGDSVLEDIIPTALASTLNFSAATNPSPELMLRYEPGFPPNWGEPDKENWIRVPFYEYAVAMMTGFFHLNWIGEDSIITFNYDTLVDDGLRRLDIPFRYGFEEGSADYWEMLRPDYKPHIRVNLFKLHGSVNWAAPKPGNKKIDVYETYAKVRGKGQRPLLVPPTWRKEFGGVLNEIWSNSVKALESATRIIIIGFSVPQTDIHFKYLLSAGLQNNISLRSIVVVDPFPDKVKENLSKILQPEVFNSEMLKFIPQDTVKFFKKLEYMQNINRVRCDFPRGGDIQ